MGETLNRLRRVLWEPLHHSASWVFFLTVIAVNGLDLLLSMAQWASLGPIWGLPIWIWSIWVVLIWIIGVIQVRLYRLEREREPRIEIEYKEESPFVITEPFSSTQPGWRFIRIQVRNRGLANIENALVVLDDIQRNGQTISPFVPIGLITQHQFAQRRKGGVFHLRGGQRKLVEVAALDETQPRSEIVLRYEDVSYPNLIPRADYRIVLKAYGGGQPVERAYRLFVDGNYLRMTPVAT